MSEEQKKRGAHFTFKGNYQPFIKDNSLPINVESSKSCPLQKGKKISKQSSTYARNLPMNLFHSPGEYNKMLIMCANPHSQTNLEKQMGIVKTLQFVNQPFFQKEKLKRQERLKDYCEQMEKQKFVQKQKSRSSQTIGNCCCCCCNDFCVECAKETSTCQIAKQRKFSQKTELLIEIDEIKKKVNEKHKKNYEKASIQSQSRANKSSKTNFHIDMLISNTLFKQIQLNRQKMLEKLDLIEREKMKQQFNQTVRNINKQRARSAQAKPQAKRSPSKQNIRQAYWNQIKDLVAIQLEKDKLTNALLSKNEQIEIKKLTKPSPKEIEFGRFIVKKANQALRQIKRQKEAKVKLQKMKAKKLLALAAEQAQILKKSQSKKFKPTQSMLQQAFKQIED